MRDDFGMSGRFGFKPDSDLREYDLRHSAIAIIVGYAVFLALVVALRGGAS